MLYRFPEKVFIDTAKDLVGQLQRACLLAFEIYYVNLCHCFQLLAISSWLLALSRDSIGFVHRVSLKSHCSWTAGALACELFVLWHRHSCLCLRCLVFSTWQ